MSKYTKGEWKLSSDAQGPNMVMHPTKKGVAICSLTNTFYPSNGYAGDEPSENPVPCKEIDGETYYEERVANARLIASAPELLEACKRALDSIERINNGYEKGYLTVDFIREAIARAEGK
jgi:hypothetical protein